MSFVASIFLSGLYSRFIYNELFNRGLFMFNTFGGFPIELIWDGPLAAIGFVLAGAWAAPRYQTVVALVLFGLGVYLTPGLVKDWSGMLYDGDSRDEVLFNSGINWTIATTYLAGALAVAGVFIVTRRPAAHQERIPRGSTTAAPPA